jgi:hypothetical protein
MPRIILISSIAFLMMAGVAASPMFVWNLFGTVNAQNPEMAPDNSTMKSENMTSGNGGNGTMMSGNTTGNDTAMKSGKISAAA